MRFEDPFSCQCKVCGTEHSIRVSQLLSLTGLCPDCGTSFHEAGVSMRNMVVETDTFFSAVTIIANVETRLGITIPDGAVESVTPWNDLTLGKLEKAICLSSTQYNVKEIQGALIAAVREEFPNAPAVLDFHAPFREGLGKVGYGESDYA